MGWWMRSRGWGSVSGDEAWAGCEEFGGSAMRRRGRQSPCSALAPTAAERWARRGTPLVIIAAIFARVDL